MSSTKMVTLRSCDGQTFEVDVVVAQESVTIKHMVEDDCADATIPLSNITGKILAKVIEYCKRHVEKPSEDDELRNFDADFVNVDSETLFDLITAANFLNIKSLLDLTLQTVANMIMEKTPDEIRKAFSIENDFTPEEEERMRKENAWAFQ